MSVISNASWHSSTFDLSEDDPYDRMVVLEEDIVHLRWMNDDLHAEVIDLRARLDISVKEQQAEVTQTDAILEHLVATRDFGMSADEPGSLADALERSLSNLSPGKVRRLISSMTTKIGSLERQAAERDTYVRFLESSLTAAHDEIAEARTDASMLNEDINHYEAELEKANEHILSMTLVIVSSSSTMSDTEPTSIERSTSEGAVLDRANTLLIQIDEESAPNPIIVKPATQCEYFSIDTGDFDRLNSDPCVCFDEDEFMSCITEWDIQDMSPTDCVPSPLHIEVTAVETGSKGTDCFIDQTLTIPVQRISSSPAKQPKGVLNRRSSKVPSRENLVKSTKEGRKCRLREERLERQSIAIASVLAYHAHNRTSSK